MHRHLMRIILSLYRTNDDSNIIFPSLSLTVVQKVVAFIAIAVAAGVISLYHFSYAVITTTTICVRRSVPFSCFPYSSPLVHCSNVVAIASTKPSRPSVSVVPDSLPTYVSYCQQTKVSYVVRKRDSQDLFILIPMCPRYFTVNSRTYILPLHRAFTSLYLLLSLS